ncbi:MAG: GntR family transcriptional regulator [Lachnospiraceae bacterium]|nr:GntR family transcriptional regulator [Lachnospiraceae bacterium]
MDTTLNQQTYEKFKKDILTFSLKPGEPVSAQKIAERYEVSRTPAREALVRLQDEGMVDIFPQSRSVISKIKRERIYQEWYVRKTLELGMVDSFFDRVRESDIDEMKKAVQELSKLGDNPRTHETSYEYLKCDDHFHAVMYRVTGEDLAAQIIGNSLLDYRRVRLLVDLDNVNKDRTVGDHERLIKYLTAKDREAYRKLLEVHLSHIIDDMKELHKQIPEMFEE